MISLTPVINASVNRCGIEISKLLSRNKNIKLVIIHDKKTNPLSYIVLHYNSRLEYESIAITGESKEEAIYNLFSYLNMVYRSVYKTHVVLKRLEIDNKYIKLKKKCLENQY